MGIIESFKNFFRGESEVTEFEATRFMVLGACCKRSVDSFNNVQQAVKELGYSDEVKNIGNFEVIAKYGVLQTPALVVNNKVLCCGKLIDVATAKELIKNELNGE